MKKHSIRTTTLLVIVPTIVIAMVVLSAIGYTYSRSLIQESMDRQMELSLSGAVESIEKSLSKNRLVVETMAQAVEVLGTVEVPTQAPGTGTDTQDALVPTPLDLGDQYGEILTTLVETNSETFGGGVWFEPYAYRADTKYFSPYCMRENGTVVYVDNYSLGEGVYYTDQDWYQNVTNTTKRSVWSAPYFDDFVKISMVTSSAPFYDANGTFLGVCTTDIDLTQLQQMIVSMDVGNGGRAFLIDGSGTYIADVDSEKLLAQSILNDPNPTMAALGKTILAQGDGTGSFEEDGETYRAWFTQVPESGWYVATVISEASLLAGVNGLRTSLAAACIIFAILAVLILVVFVSAQIIRPMRRLEQATTRIAAGDLNVEVGVRARNEIGVVSESLGQLVARLKKYIDYINEVSLVLDQIADGNLQFQLSHDYLGEFARLKEALLHIRSTLNGTLGSIVDATGMVASSSHEISNAAQTLSQGSAAQASSTDEIARRVEEISALIITSNEHLNTASQQSSIAIEQLRASDEKIQEMTGAMDEIGDRSDQIQKIVKTVEDIAFQTNILALNAAVEAARAGAAGKGFAVVADEVRNLANKSAEAAKSTTSLIENTQIAVSKGAQIAVDAAAVMGTAVTTVDSTAKIIQEIGAKSALQTQAIQTIGTEVKSVAEIVQTNSAMSEESAAKSEELFAQSKQLESAVSRFQLSRHNEY